MNEQDKKDLEEIRSNLVAIEEPLRTAIENVANAIECSLTDVSAAINGLAPEKEKKRLTIFGRGEKQWPTNRQRRK